MLLCSLFLQGCATALPWPEAPLHPELAATESNTALSRQQAIEQIVGHYAHYDVVAYDDPEQQMRTFIISYGFTDFYLQDGDLIEHDRFCHAAQKINYRSVTSDFPDAATQAIVPVDQKVELILRDGAWHIYRPPTPTLLGLEGDPLQPLNSQFELSKIVDADGDGKPGVTVHLVAGGFIKGELYIIRREIFSNFLTLDADGSLKGYVKDESEQRVLGASLSIFDRPSNPAQHPDLRLSPMILVPIADDIQSCEQLMANRDSWFPTEPTFY